MDRNNINDFYSKYLKDGTVLPFSFKKPKCGWDFDQFTRWKHLCNLLYSKNIKAKNRDPNTKKIKLPPQTLIDFQEYKKTGILIPWSYKRPKNGWTDSQMDKWKLECCRLYDRARYLHKSLRDGTNKRGAKRTTNIYNYDKQQDVIKQKIIYLQNNNPILQQICYSSLQHSLDKTKYTIYMLVSPSNKIYIGQTNNIKSRMTQYKNISSSVKGQPHILSAIQKYGFLNFKIFIVDIGLSIDQANIAQQAYIRYYMSNDRNIGYNIMRGGRINTNIEQIRLKLCKKFEFKKDGKIIQIDDLPTFCKQNNLNYRSMGSVYNKKHNMKHHKGYTRVETQWNSNWQKQKYQVIDPNGIVHKFDNLNKFCKQNKISQSSMYRVLNKVQRSHNGWKLYQ